MGNDENRAQTQHLHFGPLHMREEDLRRLAERTYRGERAIVSPDTPCDQADVDVLWRFERTFVGPSGSDSLYALWHWAGGTMASVGDLRLVTSWARTLSRVLLLLEIDWEAVDAALTKVFSQTSDVLRDSAEVTVPARTLAELLGTVADQAAELVDYDPETKAYSGLVEIVPLLGYLEHFRRAFDQGPRPSGGFLSDELVWDCLVGPAPRAQ